MCVGCEVYKLYWQLKKEIKEHWDTIYEPLRFAVTTRQQLPRDDDEVEFPGQDGKRARRIYKTVR